MRALNMFANIGLPASATQAGVQQLKQIIRSNPETPIYALGGVNAETIQMLLDCRCCGVAAIDLIADLAK